PRPRTGPRCSPARSRSCWSSCSSWSAVPTAPAPRRGRGGHGGSSPSPPPPRGPVWWRGPPGGRSPPGWGPGRCWGAATGAQTGPGACRPWRARALVTVAATAAVAGLVAGPAVLAITVGLGAGALLASRYRGADRARDLLVVGAGTGIVAGAVLLSRAPWPDATGYAGDG